MKPNRERFTAGFEVKIVDIETGVMRFERYVSVRGIEAVERWMEEGAGIGETERYVIEPLGLFEILR